MDDTTDNFFSSDELEDLLPGFRLDPEPLSSTAMSRIYLASDVRLHGRRVAVKIMADYLAAVPDFRKRFTREIELMASLDHPHIMYLLTAARKEDRLLYFVMPRAETDLKARLADGALDPVETERVITQLASALDFAHARGVVHRDVKPANILFGAGGHLYLSDFGVAKHAVGEDLTRAGDLIGTRRYTAPEVYSTRAAVASSGDVIGPAGDVYSVGAVLYHCLSGKRPFDEVDDYTVAQLQQQGKVPRIADIRPDLPREFDAIVAKAMSLDPANRYRTCGELAAAVSQAVARVGRRKAPAKARGGGRAPRRNPALTAAVLLTGLILGGVLSYVAFGPEADGSGPYSLIAGSVEPSVAPVTGDERVERAPVAGECLSVDMPYVVVACDSPEAVKRVYRIVTDPEDPNPAQPHHDDAAARACGQDGILFEYHWDDSARRDNERAWNPETDRIYYFICYQRQ
jgi:serine/threonine-protein kinase